MGDLSQSNDWKKTFIVPAIKSVDHYDFNKAKMRASLEWLLAKAFGTDSIANDLQDPFYTDQYEQEHVKPPVAELLLSADLYCRAGSLILKSDAAKPLLGHDAVIQALAQKGLYVTDHERLVTERDLCRRPILMSAHLAMIDTLMMVYTVETVSVQKVMVCMQQYSTDCADNDVPYDTEDAVISWMNKVNEYLKEIIILEQRREEAQKAEPVEIPKSPTKWYMKLVPTRYRKEQTLPKAIPWIPPVDNLLKDSTDGCALAAMLHFFCPDLVKIEDLCLKETMSLADRLYNLQLVQDFCQQHLNNCCHFSLEDMLYASSSIKNNYLVFMAELFWWFEVVKPSFVQPQVLVNEGPAPLLKDVPSVPISKVTKRSFMDRPPSPDRPSLPLRPQPCKSNSGGIRRSSSMSFVDSFLGTWPKERRSAAEGVSFDIPFDEEDSPTSTPPSRGMTRSVSTEGFGPKVSHGAKGMKQNLSFQPIIGQHVRIEEEGCPDSPLGTEHSGLNGTESPSIEEALKMIHNSDKQQPVSKAEAESQGFFLHTQAKGEPHSKAQAEEDLNSLSETKDLLSSSATEMDTGIHIRTEDIQETLDEDSSLRDCTMSMELDTDQYSETRACHSQDSTSPCPSSLGTKSPVPDTPTTSSMPGVKMTNFAEQKFKKFNPQSSAEVRGGSSRGTTPDSSDLNLSHSVSWAPSPEVSPVHQPLKDPAQAMAAEMVELRMRLEEKRRAIEAQKKKVEVAFARHRQKMGRSAFLTVVKRRNENTAPIQEDTTSSGDTKTAPETRKSPVVSPVKSPVKSLGDDGTSEADLLEYTRSIEKLNTSLNFLQTEMQRLAQQQEIIMQMREQQAWVVSTPKPSPQKQVRELRGSGTRSSGPPSPADSPCVTHRSPTNIKRKSASFHSKTPRTPRPTELKIAPCNRVLTVPQSVDSIPRLRRFSPSQSVSSSFAYFGTDPRSLSGADKDDVTAPEPFSTEGSAGDLASPNKDVQQPVKESEKGTDGQNSVLENKEKDDTKELEEEIKPTVESSVSEVLSQAVKETVIVTPTEKPVDNANQSNKNLIEVPLSDLKPFDELELEESGERPTASENLDEDQKMCCGFFFKDDMKGEDSMALKRAALLEKRLRRERETQQRKQQLEAELEQKKEEARLKAEEDRVKKEEEKARRDFIKQEYLRRKQLKLMEDMNTLVKARPATAKQKKPRPKSFHRDLVDSPRTPVRATPGSRPRVFSVSSISLASLNLGDTDSVISEKRTPRPDSADSFLSPSLSGSHNEEKDWENASTTSSVTSITEYTGPKLYKEPSAKSNKHIIQNALAHCCLAGKVNEGQKNKILEEMEKTDANCFLILFRDSGCQFRALYTYCPETEQINKLTGIGPKNISRKMIDGLYKYNSDRKQFSRIPAKTMSASVDAVTIHSHLWQTKKPGTPKKVAPNKS
ncbi:calmodulin-regulated spectrin-associated protein 2a isoform X2 [Trichomycterus rosablanca]|uniref:calmodulin-regulated spectrin-associated protein 2a isoform X2 n=1 Tax=Trichomycterus rosablanca TaxID=2290929 RepID=UPI002F35FFE4